MSSSVTRDISCPKCGSVQPTQMWSAIGANANPELREKVLTETLFDWTCEKCGYDAQLAYPCLYHDRENSFMICVAPRGDTPGDLNAMLTPSLRHVKKRIVPTLADLKEKILVFEHGLNDTAVELVKLALLDTVERKLGFTGGSAYFCYANEEQLDFAIFQPGTLEPTYRSAKSSIYRQALEVLTTLDFREGSGFLKSDGTLARELLDAYTQQ